METLGSEDVTGDKKGANRGQKGSEPGTKRERTGDKKGTNLVQKGNELIMRKRSSKGGGAQRSIQVHLIAADVILTALAVWAMRNGR